MRIVRYTIPLLVCSASLAVAQTMPTERALRFSDDLPGARTFSQPDQWRTRSEQPASLKLSDGNGSLTLIFRAAKSHDFEAVNDLGDATAPLAINRVILAPADGKLGEALRATRISGQPLRLVTSPSGKPPAITLGARDMKPEHVSLELAVDLLLENDLQLAGDGNQAFTLSGDIRESKEGTNVTKEGASSVLLAGLNNTWTGTTTVTAGTLKIADGKSLGAGPLVIKSGATLAFADASVHAGLSSSIDIEERGVLDLHRGAWIIDYADATPVDVIRAAVQDNRILSTALTPKETVVCVEASALGITTYAEREFDKTALIVAVVRMGDTNLDSNVDRKDLERVAATYKKPGTWSEGDVTGDGMVDFDDLLKLMQNYDAGRNFDADLREMNL